MDKVCLKYFSTSVPCDSPRLRRSTLYGFETLSKRGDPQRAAEIPRGTGAVFVYVSLGRVMMVDQHGTMEP